MNHARLFLVSATLLACSGSEPSSVVGPVADAALDAADAQTIIDSASGLEASTDQRIDPIAFMGQTWTYDVIATGSAPPCAPGEHAGSVIGNAMTNGKPAFQVASFCAALGTSSYALSGDHVEQDYQGTWLIALEAPVKEGATWKWGSVNMTWHSVGTVTVPAGTFADCWNAIETLPKETAYATLCRGVGPVRWVFQDASGNGYDAKLKNKNF